MMYVLIFSFYTIYYILCFDFITNDIFVYYILNIKYFMLNIIYYILFVLPLSVSYCSVPFTPHSL